MQTITNPPLPDEFVVGFRFLTNGWGPPIDQPFGSSSRRVDLLMEIVSREGMDFVTRDQHGTLHECRLDHHGGIHLGKDVRLMNRTIAWSDPLPNAPLEQIAAFADRLLQSERGDPAFLLLCEAVLEDGRRSCRLVHTASRGAETDWRMGERVLPGVLIGNAWFLDEAILVAADADRDRSFPDRSPSLPPIRPDGNAGPGPSWSPERYSPEPGDMFMASRVRTSADQPVTILQADLLKIAPRMDRDSIGAWLPGPQQPSRRFYARDIGIGGREDLEMEVERAYARTQPDEILAISVPPTGDDSDGINSILPLSHSGIRLHEVDSLVDHLYGTDLEVGVWLGFDVSWHDCGEDGAELSVDWRRATMEDLERHRTSLENIAADWEDLAECEISEDAVAVMISEGIDAEKTQAIERAAGTEAPRQD